MSLQKLPGFLAFPWLQYNQQPLVYKTHLKKEVLVKPLKIDARFFGDSFYEGEQFMNPSVSAQSLLRPAKHCLM